MMEQNTTEPTLENKVSSVCLRTNVNSESIFLPVYKMPGRLNLIQKRSRQSEYAEEICKMQRSGNKLDLPLQYSSSSKTTNPKPNIQNVQHIDDPPEPIAFQRSDAQSQCCEDIHTPSNSRNAIRAESLAIQISRTSWTKVQNANADNGGRTAVQKMAAGDWMNANFKNHTSSGNIVEMKKPRKCRKRKRHTLTTLGWMIDDADPAKRTRSGNVYGYRL